MGRFSHRFFVLAGAAVLAACDSGGSSAPARVVEAPVVTRYDLANRCFVVRANGAYVQRDGETLSAKALSAATAERFYMKPTALGRYLFHAADGTLMTATGTEVAPAAAAVDGSDWTIDGANGVFTASALEQPLATDGTGLLQLGTTAATLLFEPAIGCVAYPEMPTGIEAATFKSNPVGSEVIGFAEVHAHMAMGSDMSDGTGDRGPSAGGVMYGHAVHRFGVPHALEDCSAIHGQDGELSPEWLILDAGTVPPEPQHDTQGWPSFIDWPKSDSQLHQQMYYRWVERAYKAGLRTMVVHGTNIEALCNVAKMTVGDPAADCTDMGVGVKQVEYLFDMEKYIDAQEGGPGKGWFRIVKNPAEARAVIADGKLAVVPGLEFSNIFRCNVTYSPADFLSDPNEAGTSMCTKEEIDQQIDEIWNLGVRAVFPYHDVDSALGGTGIFNSIALNLVGFYGTQGFWRTYDCENGGEGPDFLYTAGAYMYDGQFPPFFGADPISAALIENAQGLLPLYKTGVRQCNARTVTDLGKYAIDRIMRKGFTIDIDHAEIKSKQYMLDEGAKLTPNYPMISGHGGHGGISNAQATQIVKQGGIIYPSVQNGAGYKSFMDRLEPLWDAAGTDRPLAIGYGADANGLANLPGPRGAGSTPVTYPFTLFRGPGWGPQYQAAGIAPLEVKMLAIPDGQSWDMNEVGMANYGLVADIVEEIRIEAGQKGTDALYRSAEAYLQLWEQTLQASEAARLRPATP